MHSSFACEVTEVTFWREGARVSDIGSIEDSAKFDVGGHFTRLFWKFVMFHQAHAHKQPIPHDSCTHYVLCRYER